MVSSPHPYKPSLAFTLLETINKMFYVNGVDKGTDSGPKRARNAPSDDETFYTKTVLIIALSAVETLKMRWLWTILAMESLACTLCLWASGSVRCWQFTAICHSTWYAKQWYKCWSYHPQHPSKHPKHKSIAPCDLKANQIVFVSLELETGGEYLELFNSWLKCFVLTQLIAYPPYIFMSMRFSINC